MQIAQSKTREQFPLSYRKIIKKTIEGTFINAILLLLVIFFITFSLSSMEQISLDSIGQISLNSIVQKSFFKVFSWIFSWIGITVFGGLLFVIFILIYLYQRWYFAVYFYDLTPDFIQIKKGPITPREITIPYERIQDVYVDQDILDRIFGLYDVHLSSATASSGMEAHIDGVEKQSAEGLRAILLQTVKDRISKNKSTTAPTVNNPIS